MPEAIPRRDMPVSSVTTLTGMCAARDWLRASTSASGSSCSTCSMASFSNSTLPCRVGIRSVRVKVEANSWDPNMPHNDLIAARAFLRRSLAFWSRLCLCRSTPTVSANGHASPAPGAVGAYQVEIPVDKGPENFATGTVTLDADGHPASYVVAPGDVIDYIAHRFGFYAPSGEGFDYLNTINQV